MAQRISELSERQLAHLKLEEDASWNHIRRSKRASTRSSEATSFAPLSGTKAVPLGQVSSSSSVFDQIIFLEKNYRMQSSNRSVFDRVVLPSKNQSNSARASVFDRLIFPANLDDPHGSLNSSPPYGPRGCTRCLASNHTRSNCQQAIKCHSCFGWGHVAANCLRDSNSNSKPDAFLKGKETIETNDADGLSSALAKLHLGQSNGPPVFKTFGELATSGLISRFGFLCYLDRQSR